MATPSATASTHGARDHARAQEGTRVDAMPVLPASGCPAPPEGVAAEDVVWAETVAGGNYTHKVLARGTELRLTDLTGDACAHLLLHSADRPWERLNVADTVKVLWNAYLGEGISSCPTRAGSSPRSSRTPPAGTTPSPAPPPSRATPSGTGTGPRSPPHAAGRELFKLAALKNGLAPRDLPPSVSFFQGVRVDDDGTTRFTGSAGPGRSVTLRAEQDVTVLLANVPHPLDPRPDYRCGNLGVLAYRAGPTAPGDALWDATPKAAAPS